MDFSQSLCFLFKDAVLYGAWDKNTGWCCLNENFIRNSTLFTEFENLISFSSYYKLNFENRTYLGEKLDFGQIWCFFIQRCDFIWCLSQKYRLMLCKREFYQEFNDLYGIWKNLISFSSYYKLNFENWTYLGEKIGF